MAYDVSTVFVKKSSASQTMNDTGKPCFMETVGQPQERSALAAAGSTQAPADIHLPVAATLQHTRGRWTSSCLFMLSVCVSASYVFVHRCVWLSACMPLSLTLSLSVSRSVCLFVLCVCVFDSLCRLYQSVFLSLESVCQCHSVSPCAFWAFYFNLYTA